MIEKVINFCEKADKFVLIPALFSLLTLILITVSFLLLYNRLPPKLPLFYSLPWGQAQLVSKEQFVLLPTVVVLVTLINTLIASHLHPVQYVLRRILAFSLIPISAVVFITATKILSIFT